MRRLIERLLTNNLSQIDYVCAEHNGRYADIGHAERFINIGEGFDEVHLRNLAYFGHMYTIEEGAADMDVGIRIFSKLNVSRGLPIPIAIHYRYDEQAPLARTRGGALPAHQGSDRHALSGTGQGRSAGLRHDGAGQGTGQRAGNRGR